MSNILRAMESAPNSDISINSQSRKSASGYDYGNHGINVHSEQNGNSSYQPIVTNQLPTSSISDLQTSYNQQSLYTSQVQNFPTNTEPNQPNTRMDGSIPPNTEHEQSMMRTNIQPNFQMQYNQPPPGSVSNSLALANQGALVSGGSYPNVKPTHHNLGTNEPYITTSAQGLVHAPYANPGVTNAPTSSAGNPNPMQSSSHSMQVAPDYIMGRNNLIPGQNMNSNHSVHSQDAVSNMNSSHSNHYHQVNRGPNVSSHIPVHPMQHTQHSNANNSYTPNPVHYANSVPNPNYAPAGPTYSSIRNGSSRAWHSSEHSQVRESVADEIVKILRSRKPNAADNWHDKLPHMAKRLEDALYQDAGSYEEYADRNTLKHRLQQLALTMGSKNQNKMSSVLQPQNSQNLPATQSHNQMLRQPASNYSTPFPPTLQSQAHVHQNGNPSQFAGYHQTQPPLPSSHMSTQYSQVNSMHRQVHPNQISMPTVGYHAGAPNDYSNQNNLRSNLAPTGGMMTSTQYVPSETNTSMDSYNRGYHPTLSQSGFKTDDGHYNSRPMMHPGAPQNPNFSANISVPHVSQHNSANQSSDEHRKQVLKQQQQRLLLLRHASKCPHENGRCPVTPHCWNMKQLWKHIMSCKDQDCKVPHCVSSRYVLSHYSKCKEPTCPVCGPVREAIKRNYERSRDVVKMARNPNAGLAPPLNPLNSNHNTGVAVNKTEEPEKKKVRRKSDGNNLNGGNGNQVVQPIVIRQPPRKIYPLDPISSAIYSFTNDQINSHFRTIHEGLRITVSKIKEMCKPILEELFRLPHVQSIFGAPVDPIALGLMDYFDVVKAPMDLGSVLKRLESGSYRDFQNFVSDVHLTFDNAMLYNPKNSDVYSVALNAKREFDKKYRAKLSDFERQIDENRKNKEACLICGEISLKYEPPVYYCNGTCAQRIRRNAVFYSNNSNTYHWCSLCFNAMKENETIRLPDCIISKAELATNKKKHIEESGEGWVECEGGCKRWVHQICSLFNNRRNVGDDVSYVCPVCLQEKRKKSPNDEIVAPTTKKMKASDLPVTTLSDFLEKRIMKRLEIAYEETANKFGIDLTAVERCPALTLRQVSCIDKLQPVRDGFYQRYKEKSYPTDFPCRSKCLVLFQNIDGQDVILFGMYVYEYGHKCPQPNQRRVYISYLDSVHYLRPKQYRTIVYHEILISYLDYVKARGFHTVHIWACPPQKGDDYILYVHPQDQKTPKPQILRLWYDEMLKRCMERGIVCEMTDLHSEYLADPSIEAVSLPYFEGDYWVNEAEVIIKNLGDGRRDDELMNEDVTGSKSKRRSKSKRPAKVATAISGSFKSERDPLMAKLAAIIEPMKDTFFVARLHPKEYAEKFSNSASNGSAIETTDQEKTDQELQEEALSGQDIVPQLPEIRSASSSKGVKRTREDDETSQKDEEPSAEEDSEDDFLKDATMITANSSNNEKGEASDEVQRSGAPYENENNAEVNALSESTIAAEETVVDNPSVEGVGDVMQPQLTSSSYGTGSKKIIICGDEMPNLPDDTEDVDDIQESEHFDTRQSFLNLCQGNHYQFDQLRRAKHSSMMVLYHLHNPDAPKFVPACGSCHTDILTGNRYRCEKCELDYCQSCVTKIGAAIHHHPLRAVSGNSAPTKLTEEQRRERQRTIQLHIQLLNHAAHCVKCESRNCAKMKDFLVHESQCKIKNAGGCRICQRISNLLSLHARSCRTENCKVPQCLKLREHLRQLALSQQRMDDRRRKKMNSEYSRGNHDNRVEDEDA